MSLASRLVNLFSPSQVPHLAQPNRHTAVTPEDNTYDAFNEPYSKLRSRDPPKSGTMEAEEIEARPPYLHVSQLAPSSSEELH